MTSLKNTDITKTNAANSQFRSYECKHRSSVRDFEEMFCEDIEYNGTYIRRKDLNIPDKYTTDPQAEILISGIIEPKFIRRDLLSLPLEDMQDYKKYMQNQAVREFPDHGVEPSLFGCRKDPHSIGSRKTYMANRILLHIHIRPTGPGWKN